MFSPTIVTLAAEYAPTHTLSDGILVGLGFAMIVTFMTLIMLGRSTPMIALILVPTIFGLIAGAGLGIGDMVMEAIKDMAPTAALLMFAIMYFGIMIDVGLFDPLIRIITRALGNDPAKIVLGTALLAGVVSLDGDGSTTFIITTSAMLPLYLRMGMSPVVLTVVAGLINGTMNILPWGGPTVRAAAALGLDPAEVFVPMIPSLIVGVIVVFAFAWFLGIAERKRLGGSVDTSRFQDDSTGGSTVAGGAGTGGTGGSGGAGSTPYGHSPDGCVPVGSGCGGVLVEVRYVNTNEHSYETVSVSEVVEDPSDGLTDTMLDPHRSTLRPKLIWFNLVLTLVVMVALVADILPLAFVFMVGTGLALAVNFPKVKDQATEMLALLLHRWRSLHGAGRRRTRRRLFRHRHG